MVGRALARHGRRRARGRRVSPLARPAAPPREPAARPAGAVRVLAHPAFAAGNLYTTQLYRHAERLGAAVQGFTPARALAGRWDVVHVHWPEAALNHRMALRAWAGPRALLALLDRARARGARVAWTVHNLRAHDGLRAGAEARFWDRLLPRVDGWISLSRSGREAALERFPALAGKPGWVVPHGHYRGAYPDTVSRAEARARLDLPPDAPVVAFVGQVREYKNVPALVQAARALPGVRLLVAGRVRDPGLEARVREAAAGGDVRLAFGHVPDEELQLYLRAADLVVLPFREILNSGSAVLALSFDRPVLVPRLGALGELQEAVGADWVRTFAGELTPALLAEALAWARGPGRAERAPLQALEWEPLAAATVDAYRALAGA